MGRYTFPGEKMLYETYIAKSRYARYIDAKKRRENWDETVERYFDFLENHLQQKHNYELSESMRAELQSAVTNFEVMPSMRALMTAGRALERDNTAGYNCSYLPIDDPKAFDEAMFILLCGTGVGFSVERQYIAKLPEVPEKIFDSESTIVVSDSKEGWAKSLRQVIAMLYSGEAPRWDVSKVRAAGARLKTFGGRASGPEPLVELFKFVVKVFKNAQGRKLNSIECHDIMCKVGEVVVVGGVRRSAMISLSNLSDDRMRNAKTGSWWETQGQRALANNSACHTERPDVGIFMKEWSSLYESKSGERGIFNREAAKNIVKMNGRRSPDFEFGTNPCAEIILRPYQFCNLTEIIVRATDTLEDLLRKARIATIMGTFQSTMTHFPYLRKIWRDNTEQERLLGVSMTGILDNHLLNNPTDDGLPARLEALKTLTIDTNAELAAILGIPASAAITAVKPSGTVSQLTDTASGIHPRHAAYYYRRIRGDIKDPLTKAMMAAGVPHDPDVMKPGSTMVFTFPKKAPEGAVLRSQLDAIKHLNLWLVYQQHYCEHKPSVTISVSEREWPAVGAFVWDHFDEMSGVSFLPYDGGNYKQAPYEDCTQAEFEALSAKMPKSIDWDAIVEMEDNVEGTQMLACTAGGCEI
jgi:ribonucleoside-diphosphate reductase alpha chain